jgi:hypothetical protein
MAKRKSMVRYQDSDGGEGVMTLAEFTRTRYTGTRHVWKTIRIHQSGDIVAVTADGKELASFNGKSLKADHPECCKLVYTLLNVLTQQSVAGRFAADVAEMELEARSENKKGGDETAKKLKIRANARAVGLKDAAQDLRAKWPQRSYRAMAILLQSRGHGNFDEIRTKLPSIAPIVSTKKTGGKC